MKQILLRILAVFAASGLSVIGAGAIAGVELWKACLMAGVAGVATVVEGLARAYMDDGQIDKDEINSVFNKVDGSARKEEFSQAFNDAGMGSATASAYLAHKNV